MPIVSIAAAWVLQVVASLLFVFIGVLKFHDVAWARNFARWGYPDGFSMVVGAIETVGGVMLLVPRLTRYAAAVLMTVMVGAIGTHLVHGELRRLFMPTLLLVVVGVIAWLRRER